MMDKDLLLAIDQGTSGTKAILFSREGRIRARGTVALKSSYPATGYVEQDPEEIYRNVLDSLRACLKAYAAEGGAAPEVVSCGISNQRETMIVWDEKGDPLHPAIVWQCKRSVDICRRLQEEGFEQEIRKKTGLIIDPYFSGSKMIWLMEHHEPVRKAVSAGKAFFGTVDTWLLYRLTGGTSYKTDYTNACRTLFFNLKGLDWDRELLAAFGLERLQLPEPVPSSHHFGQSDFGGLLSRPVPITGMIGDSHAAAFGEGCYRAGTAKATLGTGSSILWNAGSKPVFSDRGMVSTICWSHRERVDYALEGVIVTCGATIEWMKNQLGLFADSRETEAMARSVPGNTGVCLVPAFSGLGAPHWKMNARAMITGMTLGTGRNHLVRAALESIPFQVKDVISLMEEETGTRLKELMADGGISANSFVMQMLSDLLDTRVTNPGMADVSALGAALVAGLAAGVYSGMDELEQRKAEVNQYRPGTTAAGALDAYRNWQDVIARHYP